MPPIQADLDAVEMQHPGDAILHPRAVFVLKLRTRSCDKVIHRLGHLVRTFLAIHHTFCSISRHHVIHFQNLLRTLGHTWRACLLICFSRRYRASFLKLTFYAHVADDIHDTHDIHTPYMTLVFELAVPPRPHGAWFLMREWAWFPETPFAFLLTRGVLSGAPCPVQPTRGVVSLTTPFACPHMHICRAMWHRHSLNHSATHSLAHALTHSLIHSSGGLRTINIKGVTVL